MKRKTADLTEQTMKDPHLDSLVSMMPMQFLVASMRESPGLTPTRLVISTTPAFRPELVTSSSVDQGNQA